MTDESQKRNIVVNNRNLCSLIRRLQHQDGLSQKQLADRLDVSPSIVSLVINGKRPASRKMVRALIKAYPDYAEEIASAWQADIFEEKQNDNHE